MFPLPDPEFIAQVQQKFTEELFSKVFQKLKVDDQTERNEFKRIVTLVSAAYLTFLDNNPDRLTLTPQQELLQEYKEALETAKNVYKRIIADRTHWFKALHHINVSTWVQIHSKKKTKERRIYIWLESCDYLIVLAEKKNCYFLVTAYCTDTESSRESLRKKRRESSRGSP